MYVTVLYMVAKSGDGKINRSRRLTGSLGSCIYFLRDLVEYVVPFACIFKGEYISMVFTKQIFSSAFIVIVHISKNESFFFPNKKIQGFPGVLQKECRRLVFFQWLRNSKHTAIKAIFLWCSLVEICSSYSRPSSSVSIAVRLKKEKATIKVYHIQGISKKC